MRVPDLRDRDWRRKARDNRLIRGWRDMCSDAPHGLCLAHGDKAPGEHRRLWGRRG